MWGNYRLKESADGWDGGAVQANRDTAALKNMKLSRTRFASSTDRHALILMETSSEQTACMSSPECQIIVTLNFTLRWFWMLSLADALVWLLDDKRMNHLLFSSRAPADTVANTSAVSVILNVTLLWKVLPGNHTASSGGPTMGGRLGPGSKVRWRL